VTAPHHITIEESGLRVSVIADGVLLADSARALVLHEGPLPPRWYIPRGDVRMDLLVPSTTVTTCPFKGTTEHFSARVGDRVVPDVAWSYPEPIPSVEDIRGRIAFYGERVEVTTA
jgi:uncharacterized protein (DUF427 family)